MVRAEDLRHGQGVGPGVLILPVPKALGDLTGEAGGEGDEALGVPPQELQVDAGLPVKAPQMKGAVFYGLNSDVGFGSCNRQRN